MILSSGEMKYNTSLRPAANSSGETNFVCVHKEVPKYVGLIPIATHISNVKVTKFNNSVANIALASRALRLPSAHQQKSHFTASASTSTTLPTINKKTRTCVMIVGSTTGKSPFVNKHANTKPNRMKFAKNIIIIALHHFALKHHDKSEPSTKAIGKLTASTQNIPYPTGRNQKGIVLKHINNAASKAASAKSQIRRFANRVSMDASLNQKSCGGT